MGKSVKKLVKDWEKQGKITKEDRKEFLKKLEKHDKKVYDAGYYRGAEYCEGWTM